MSDQILAGVGHGSDGIASDAAGDAAKHDAPKVRWLAMEVGIPGVVYGEFELARDGLSKSPFKASRFSLAPGVSTNLDEHSVRECWIVARGEGLLIHQDRAVSIRTGEMLLFESYERHQVTNTGTEDLVIFSMWWPR